jgi:hypothetical protein
MVYVIFFCSAPPYEASQDQEEGTGIESSPIFFSSKCVGRIAKFVGGGKQANSYGCKEDGIHFPFYVEKKYWYQVNEKKIKKTIKGKISKKEKIQKKEETHKESI